jgi:hypothetical protein
MTKNGQARAGYPRDLPVCDHDPSIPSIQAYSTHHQPLESRSTVDQNPPTSSSLRLGVPPACDTPYAPLCSPSCNCHFPLRVHRRGFTGSQDLASFTLSASFLQPYSLPAAENVSDNLLIAPSATPAPGTRPDYTHFLVRAVIRIELESTLSEQAVLEQRWVLFPRRKAAMWRRKQSKS